MGQTLAQQLNPQAVAYRSTDLSRQGSFAPWAFAPHEPLRYNPVAPQALCATDLARHGPLRHGPVAPQALCARSPLRHKPSAPQALCSTSPLRHKPSAPQALCASSPLRHKPSAPRAFCASGILCHWPFAPWAFCATARFATALSATCACIDSPLRIPRPLKYHRLPCD